MHIETLLVHGGEAHKSITGSISMPIYQTATFEHPELGKSTGFDYSRTQNPTRQKLENSYAVLESGSVGLAFTTGMAAIAAIFDLFKALQSIFYLILLLLKIQKLFSLNPLRIR